METSETLALHPEALAAKTSQKYGLADWICRKGQERSIVGLNLKLRFKTARAKLDLILSMVSHETSHHMHPAEFKPTGTVQRHLTIRTLRVCCSVHPWQTR